jgi:hypothetical protein
MPIMAVTNGLLSHNMFLDHALAMMSTAINLLMVGQRSLRCQRLMGLTGPTEMAKGRKGARKQVGQTQPEGTGSNNDKCKQEVRL